MYLTETKCKALDWVPLTQGGDQSQAHVNKTIHFSVKKKDRGFLDRQNNCHLQKDSAQWGSYIHKTKNEDFY